MHFLFIFFASVVIASEPGRIVFPSDQTIGRKPVSYTPPAFRTKITNVSDFFNSLGLTEKELDDLSSPIGGRQKEADFVLQSACEVEMRTIDLNTENTINGVSMGSDAELLLFPKCVRLKRCAGCCDSAERTICTATKKSTKQIRRAAIRLKRSAQGTAPETSTQITTVEEHEECRCVCKIKEEDCNAMQEYQPSQCRCVCQNAKDELDCRNSKDKVWDNAKCQCKCENEKRCSTGLRFSHEKCNCVPN